MKYCPRCGKDHEDADETCARCGYSFSSASVPEPVTAPAPVEAENAAPVVFEPAPVVTEPVVPAAPEPAAPTPAPVRAEPVVPAPTPVAPVAPEMPKPAEKPHKQLLTTFQYILLFILFAIPVVGLVFLFVFGCGNPKNASLKRFSLAVLILTLIVWILIIAAVLVGYVVYADVLPEMFASFRQWFAGPDLSALGL